MGSTASAAAGSSTGGRLRRAMDRLSSGPAPHEAAELKHQVAKAGCGTIDSYTERDVTRLHGILRTVTLQPRAGVAALEAELYDGSGTVTLIWLGRRRIAGIECGRELTVSGRIGCQDGAKVLYNPRYELTA